jgi:putative thioredoxin
VVVDFWAEWCGPCRVLGPVLERGVAARSGALELAKVDVDSNQRLAAQYGIRGIPAVKAFRNGAVVDEFVGAQAPAAVERFLDTLIPSEADKLVQAGDEPSLRRALELDPRHLDAARSLGRLLLARDEAGEAASVLRPFAADFIADGLAARAELSVASANGASAGDGLESAFAAWDDGEMERALESLQDALAEATEPDERDRIRRVMVAIFSELGADHPLAREHRRRLSAALH